MLHSGRPSKESAEIHHKSSDKTHRSQGSPARTRGTTSSLVPPRTEIKKSFNYVQRQIRKDALETLG